MTTPPQQSDRPDPSSIMALATGYWGSAAFIAAVRLGVFDVLADGPQSAESISTSLEVDCRALSALLDACAALDLLIRDSVSEPEVIYADTKAADAFLVSGSPGYIGGAILWSADQYAAWGDLAETVRTGKPAVEPALHLGSSPEQTRTFVLGMQNRAKGVARGVVNFLNLDGCKSMLDVGGGPGAYSLLLTERYPDLHATVLDLPGIINVARDLVAHNPSSARIMLRPGDATRDQYGWEEYDAILFSGVLHQMSQRTILHMLENAKAALNPGGRVIISDVMLQPDRTSPPFAALFSVQMLLTSAEGGVFSCKECSDLLKRAGFVRIAITRLPPPLPYTVITAFAS